MAHETSRATISPDLYEAVHMEMRQKESQEPRPTHPLQSPFVKCYQVLVAYTIQVCESFSFSNTTTFRATFLLARLFTSPRVNVESQKPTFQLVVLVCIAIAAKFEETSEAQVNITDLLDVCGGIYSAEMFIQVERFALDYLGWAVNDVTSACFSNLFLSQAALGSPLVDPEVKRVAILLLGLTLQDYTFLEYLPSRLCAAVLKTARAVVKRDLGPAADFQEWDERTTALTQYTAEDLEPCCLHLWQKYHNFRNLAQNNSPRPSVATANATFTS